MCSDSSDKLYKEKLIKTVKKEVKQIMEEAVTKKFIYEDSGSITSLCSAVEACVSHGLKRRALGLFKNSSTTALIHKVAKSFLPAANIVQMMIEIESSEGNKRSSSGGSESTNKGSKMQLQKRTSTSSVASCTGPSSSTLSSTKYLWIRLALFERDLAKIIDYIVGTSSKYYEKDALVADSDYGSILSSLLVGPCALHYSKLKNSEHNMWNDPPADELVQRHRISSGHFPPSDSSSSSSPILSSRPTLNYKRMSGLIDSSGQLSKDYVDTLHQNFKSTLLFGKNNVQVYLKEEETPLAGYLSLHQFGDMLNLKWTPNQLMNGANNSSSVTGDYNDKSIYWAHALNLLVHELVYLHCHQDQESYWIVLVGQDGIQYPPIHFPRGGHLLDFLSCLENGLAPNGMLDPPLWSHKGEVNFPMLGKSKTKSGSPTAIDTESTLTGSGEEQQKSDFVFRIVVGNFDQIIPPVEEMLDNSMWKFESKLNTIPPTTPRSTPIHSVSTTSSTSSSRSLDQQNSLIAGGLVGGGGGAGISGGEPIQSVCQSMRRQIISRAFYGWLTHCRHLRTIRTHLTGLVLPNIMINLKGGTEGGGGGGSGESVGLTTTTWEKMQQDETGVDMMELYRLVYLGGMDHSLRPTVWPILLRGSMEGPSPEDMQKEYDDLICQWTAVQVIVQQRDKETNAANLVKLSSDGSTNIYESTKFCSAPQAQESNEVFEESNSSSNNITNNHNHHHQSNNNKNNEEKGEKEQQNGSKEQQQGHHENGDSESPEDDGISCDGIIYSNELIDIFGLNLHRIDKDVKRCDRNYTYFMDEKNLEKLRNVMCTFVWENMELGYVQGMCDLAGPLLVILDNEASAYSAFRNLMKRMAPNFPSGGDAMDSHFSNMRSLLQVLDHDLFSLIRQNGDYSHLYFCYRWFLLDFKREFTYSDIFLVWETIWAARFISSSDFVLFIALALLNYYRDILLSNAMDFTDIIKFFNEMAERHNAKIILQKAREFVLQLQTLIQNK